MLGKDGALSERPLGRRPVRMGGGSERPGMERYYPIDVVKALGILVVIWIHSFGPLYGPEWVVRLNFLARWAVPGFFFCSGFLAQRSGPGSFRDFLAMRGGRILPPYLVASVLAILLRNVLYGQPLSFRRAVVELLSGSAFGIYYFVPLIFGALFLGFVVSRVPSLATILWVAFVGSGLLCEGRFLADRGFFWELRNPLRWWGYFLSGWHLSIWYAPIQALGVATPRRLGKALLVLVACAFGYYLFTLQAGWGRSRAILQYFVIYATIFGILLSSHGSRERGWVRFFSEATYPIYLYHFFFIEVARQGLRVSHPMERLVLYVCGLVGALVVVVGGRRLLGHRARWVIG